MDAFCTFHPLVNFIYFALTIGCTMAFQHPVCQAVSLGCALAYAICLDGRKTVLSLVKFLLPLLLLTVLINPVFSQQGDTVLHYFPNGNPLTLESILYGLSAGGMLVSAYLWFRCLGNVISSDKLMYLFGKAAPALSLLLSMTLRFVPGFKKQFSVVVDAQRTAGRDVSTGSITKRVGNAIAILSVMVSWALENAVDTADSMKSRGYGLAGRTAFSIYRFEKRDIIALVWLLTAGAAVIAGGITKQLSWQYYPYIDGVLAQPVSIAIYALYFGLCITPTIINGKENAKWRCLKSKI